jgi:hypothetical protein
VQRVRRPGADRPGIEQACPGLWEALDALIEPEERSDPQNPQASQLLVIADAGGSERHRAPGRVGARATDP